MRAIIVLLFLVLCGCVTPPASAPIDTSISEIQKDPWAWHGKLVRVRGTFDECISLNCHFCETVEGPEQPHPHTDRRCIGISFYDDYEEVTATTESDRKQSVRSAAADIREELVRFTTSTIDALYDADCSGIPEGGKPGDAFTGDDIVICTDRAPELVQARIVQTHIRRPSIGGHIGMYGTTALLIPDDETVAAIESAFQHHWSRFNDDIAPPNFVYLYDESADWLSSHGVEAVGGACNCLDDACVESDWPRREGDTWIDTPANPYICYSAERVDGVWRFPIQ